MPVLPWPFPGSSQALGCGFLGVFPTFSCAVGPWWWWWGGHGLEMLVWPPFYTTLEYCETLPRNFCSLREISEFIPFSIFVF